jgi:hypothetical protein
MPQQTVPSMSQALAPEQDTFLGLSSRTYLVALAAVVVVVVALAVFIVWALLSGAATLG